ncbi:uncharacterized protein LOC114294593 [Camellia sinensis]|uniref:uncharacterized protein LOC114294593 n=1 Tax=Camellia sinensis TaxID=4442 RepID=UPI0010357230|nr:uncharacterized protein LOC114294593 [Camellia sinensis]
MDSSGNTGSEQWRKKKVFKSKEELLSCIGAIGRKNDFVIVIKTSDYGGSHRTPRIYLACTKKCGCPFELRAHKLMADDAWMLDVAYGTHNHAPAKHFEGHSFAGRLYEEETSLLVDISKSMVRPKEILVTLKQKDALNVTTMKTFTMYVIGIMLLRKLGDHRCNSCWVN